MFETCSRSCGISYNSGKKKERKKKKSEKRGEQMLIIRHRFPFALFPLLVFFFSPPVLLIPVPPAPSRSPAFRFSPDLGAAVALAFTLTTVDFPTGAPPPDASFETCASAEVQSTFSSLIANLDPCSNSVVHRQESGVSGEY